MVPQPLFESHFPDSNVKFLHETAVVSSNVSVSTRSIRFVEYWLLMFAKKKKNIFWKI